MSVTQFRRLIAPFDAPDTSWTDFEAVIEEAAPKADPADHRHLVRSVAGGAAYFVTRDGALNDAAPEILDAVGVQVMRPEELISHIDRVRAEERYEPPAPHATSFVVGSASGREAEFVVALLNYGWVCSSDLAPLGAVVLV